MEKYEKEKDIEIEKLRCKVSELQQQLATIQERNKLAERREYLNEIRMNDFKDSRDSNQKIILLLQDECVQQGRLKAKRNEKASEKEAKTSTLLISSAKEKWGRKTL